MRPSFLLGCSRGYRHPHSGGTRDIYILLSMKINSVFGKMTGKIGNIVVASVGGEVIGREYNPNVSNPNTGAQQNTRSKFKLASQLSASLAPVIAIKKEGNVSGRNQFVKINFDAIRYSLGQADINLNVVQLTKSQKPFPGFSADRSSGTAIAVQLNADSAANLSRVVYAAYKKQSDGSLLLLDSKTCSVPGSDGLFADVLRYDASAVVIYAYGMKDLESGITSKFGNMQAATAEDVAKLLVSNTENMQAVQLTKTAGLTMAEGEDTADSDDVEHLTVSLVISGNGSAVGGGRFEAGQTVTLRATPDEEATFDGWFADNASGALISTANPYSFEVEQNVTICAKFHGGPLPKHQVTVTANPVAGGTVSGGGEYTEGTLATVNAIMNENYNFDGWYRNGTKVSSNPTFSFTVDSDVTLEARFVYDTNIDIQTALINGADWNRNGQGVNDNQHITGTVGGGSNGHTALIVKDVPKPNVGDTVSASINQDQVVIAGGTFDINPAHEGDTVTGYLVVGTKSGNNLTVEAVWEYSCSISAGGGN